jgi:hypothetical protein
MAFVWDISLFKYDVRSWWPFTLGYTPVVIILIIFNIAGFMHSNEDKLIIKQRTQRGRAADLDMGLVQKPSWWTKGTGKAYASDMERLRGLVADTNIHGANPSARGADGVELTDLPSPRDAATSNDLGTQNTASGLRSRSRSRGRDSTPNVRSPATLSPAGSERPWMARQGSTHSTNTLASAMTGQTLTSQTARPQVVRSMLDV